MDLHGGNLCLPPISCRNMYDRYSIGVDDAVQKSMSFGSCDDVLHESIFIGSSCLHWEGVRLEFLSVVSPIKYSRNYVK